MIAEKHQIGDTVLVLQNIDLSQQNSLEQRIRRYRGNNRLRRPQVTRHTAFSILCLLSLVPVAGDQIHI